MKNIKSTIKTIVCLLFMASCVVHSVSPVKITASNQLLPIPTETVFMGHFKPNPNLLCAEACVTHTVTPKQLQALKTLTLQTDKYLSQ